MRLNEMMHKLGLSGRQASARRQGPRPWPLQKQDFVQELGRRLERLLQDVDLVLRAASRRSGDERRELLDGLRDLRQRALQLRRALEVYQQEDGRSWDHFRGKAEDRWAELRRDLARATERYRKSLPPRLHEARTRRSEDSTDDRVRPEGSRPEGKTPASGP